MDKAMFRHEMSLAGYSDDVIEKIEKWLTSDESCPLPPSEKRDIICKYARICTNISMIPTFIRVVDGMARQLAISYDLSSDWVVMIIAGWSHLPRPKADIDEDAEGIAALRSAAPWLLEVVGCFQPGDANEIAYAMDVLIGLPYSQYTGDSRFLRRLLQAAKIMEERE